MRDGRRANRTTGARNTPSARFVASADMTLRRTFFFLVLFSASAPALARADYQVDFDCYLNHSDLTCSDVRRAYEASVPGLVFDERDACLEVVLRDAEDAVGRRYFATFRGTPHGATSREELTLSIEIPHSAGHDRALPLLIALLQRGMVPFLEVRTPGTGHEGALRIDAATSPAAEHEDPSGFYIAPQISGEYVRAGVEIATVAAALDLNYSNESWRWQLGGQGRYRYLDLPIGDDRLEGSMVDARASSSLARSFGGFSVGAFGGALRQPNNNLDLRLYGGLGAEWVRAPFLRANEANLGARLTLATYWDVYALANQQGHGERVYPLVSLSLFGRWHTRTVDFEIEGNASTLLDELEFWGLGVALEATLRLTERLSLGVGARFRYRHQAVNAPANPSGVNAVAVALAGSDFNRYLIESQISLRYAWGNALLRSQDQRWR